MSGFHVSLSNAFVFIYQLLLLIFPSILLSSASVHWNTFRCVIQFLLNQLNFCTLFRAISNKLCQFSYLLFVPLHFLNSPRTSICEGVNADRVEFLSIWLNVETSHVYCVCWTFKFLSKHFLFIHSFDSQILFILHCADLYGFVWHHIFHQCFVVCSIPLCTQCAFSSNEKKRARSI